MPPFPFHQLNSVNREQVITKVNGKSYFRLQKTCHEVEDFIRKSKNISVLLEGTYCLKCYQDGNTCRFTVKRSDESTGEIDAQHLYGIRLEELYSPKKGENFEELCDSLQKYRITCKKLHMEWTELNKEQCSVLFKILKPVGIEMTSSGSKRFEALNESKTLTNIRLHLDSIDGKEAVNRLLPQCQELECKVTAKNSQQLAVLLSILELLFSVPLPNLHEFRFSAGGTRRIDASKEELTEFFRNYQLKMEDKKDDSLFMVGKIEPPKDFSQCKILIYGPSASVHLNR